MRDRSAARFYDRTAVEAFREEVVKLIIEKLIIEPHSISAEQVRSRIPLAALLSADSLDLVELVMTLEEDLSAGAR